jgi:hypothetical protein
MSYEIKIEPHPTLRGVLRLTIDGVFISDNRSRKYLDDLAATLLTVVTKEGLQQALLAAKPQVTIAELTDADKGRYVAYRPFGQPHITEFGFIKSWNSLYVFVVFLGRRKHFDPKEGERTPMACPPSTLSFVTRRADGGFDL